MHQIILHVRIKENHVFAKIAARVLHAPKGMAITIGNTIYLHHASTQDLIQNRSWLQHELTHVLQYKKQGVLAFFFCYLQESIKKGYLRNKYEQEARNHENVEFIKIGYEVFFYN